MPKKYWNICDFSIYAGLFITQRFVNSLCVVFETGVCNASGSTGEIKQLKSIVGMTWHVWCCLRWSFCQALARGDGVIYYVLLLPMPHEHRKWHQLADALSFHFICLTPQRQSSVIRLNVICYLMHPPELIWLRNAYSHRHSLGIAVQFKHLKQPLSCKKRKNLTRNFYRELYSANFHKSALLWLWYCRSHFAFGLLIWHAVGQSCHGWLQRF